VIAIRTKNYSHTGNVTFPHWERGIPTLGIYAGLTADNVLSLDQDMSFHSTSRQPSWMPYIRQRCENAYPACWGLV